MFLALLIQTNRWYPDDGRKIYFTFICISILIISIIYWQYYFFRYFSDLDVLYLPNTPSQRWEFADSRLVRSVGSSGTCSKQTRTASNKLQLVLGSLELHWNKKYSITIFNLIANDIKNSWRHFGWISKKNINYLLWGLLGTNIGSTPPTTPKIAVKRITGKSANPMMTLYDLIL